MVSSSQRDVVHEILAVIETHVTWIKVGYVYANLYCSMYALLLISTGPPGKQPLAEGDTFFK